MASGPFFGMSPDCVSCLNPSSSRSGRSKASRAGGARTRRRGDRSWSRFLSFSAMRTEKIQADNYRKYWLQMAHNLFNNQMAFVGKEPWHGLGNPVSPNVSAAEMCREASLDWTVEKLPAPGARIVNPKKTIYDRYLIYREPIAIKREKEKVALGMVGSGYEPLQNRDAFAFFAPFIDSRFAQYETAGALGNGERVWVQAKLREQVL